MSRLNESEAPLYQDTSRWFGITPPISEDLPEEADLIQTRALFEALRSFGVFEDDLELKHREKVVKQLESLFKEWLIEICVEMNVPESVTAHVGGRVIPFGSFHLGAHMKGADIDVLCVGPGFLEREDFFTSFYKKLKAQEEVKDIRAIEEASVPVIKLSYDGTEIDLVFARVGRKSVSDKLDLLDSNLLRSMDKRCVKSLNGFRVTEEILRAVPNVHNFRLALRAIKLWAKRRNIYSSALGFLGGVSWAILVARICQLYPNATAATLVTKFFKAFCLMKWPNVVQLRVPEACNLNHPVWDPRINPSDRRHVMPIITPAYPEQNSAVNVSPSTLAIMMEEIQRGRAITEEILQKNADWDKLFETPNFFEKYKHYILVEASSATVKPHLEWIGLVESKIRLLVGKLERNVYISLAHVNPQSFPGSTKSKANTMWLIGLDFNMDGYKNLNIDVTQDLLSFRDTIYSQAKTCKIYGEGMTVSARYMSRDNLTWQMPNGQLKRVYSPKRQPTESRQRAVPASGTAPVNAGRAAAKRKGCAHTDVPTKKVKADKASVSLAKGSAVRVSTPIKPASSSMTPKAKTRPRSPDIQTSPKKFKSDKEPASSTSSQASAGVSLSQSPRGTKRPHSTEPETPSKRAIIELDLPTVELPEQSVCPIQPATAVKKAIRLQLISRRN
ncbi:poly(A) polymerase type 3-like [Plectropomus leopardus]|uniref:poly(A) polymerase type 3-like n=1 Tax=Plectropomus leopardus TaxID=160734 RepID=UPI001C4BFDE5|nr:poly(A) polymerase type 3-like [Plectropomus leopardus]